MCYYNLSLYILQHNSDIQWKLSENKNIYKLVSQYYRRRGTCKHVLFLIESCRIQRYIILFLNPETLGFQQNTMRVCPYDWYQLAKFWLLADRLLLGYLITPDRSALKSYTNQELQNVILERFCYCNHCYINFNQMSHMMPIMQHLIR